MHGVLRCSTYSGTRQLGIRRALERDEGSFNLDSWVRSLTSPSAQGNALRHRPQYRQLIQRTRPRRDDSAVELC